MVFGLKTGFKTFKDSFCLTQKNYNYPPKNANFDPHAAKAQKKKLWHLTDQGTVATTNPADHQTGLQKPVTGQKDQPHQEEILHQVLIRPKVPDHQKNITVKLPAKNDLFRHPEKAVMINLRAALAAARAKRNHLPEKAGHIAEDRQMVSHQVKKEHLPQKAGHIPAELLTMTQDREKALAVKEQVTKNLLHRAANHQQVHLMLMTGLKEALAAKDQAINLLHRAANHQQVHLMLMINPKEALAVIKNSATGHQRAAGLKKQAAISHTMPTDHSAQNQHTIK
ncbi:MAG: hypothetical protein JWQ54_2955 [Mucilaginibacter sp.]|nr:hypothetical protein [Mucilaginibacter sp.]